MAVTMSMLSKKWKGKQFFYFIVRFGDGVTRKRLLELMQCDRYFRGAFTFFLGYARKKPVGACENYTKTKRPEISTDGHHPTKDDKRDTFVEEAAELATTLKSPSKTKKMYSPS